MPQPFDAAISDHEHIEAYAAVTQLRVLVEEQPGGSGDAALLRGPDARRGAAKAIVGTSADFSDHQQFACARDHVELADTAQEIARDYLETLRFEKGGRGVLRK